MFELVSLLLLLLLLTQLTDPAPVVEARGRNNQDDNN